MKLFELIGEGFSAFKIPGNNEAVVHTVSHVMTNGGLKYDLDVEVDLYLTPEQERIVELEHQLRVQNEALQKALAKNKVSKPPRRAHITRKEVVDIEKSLEDKVSDELIFSTFNISYTTLCRIKTHTHGLSTALPVEEK